METVFALKQSFLFENSINKSDKRKLLATTSGDYSGLVTYVSRDIYLYDIHYQKEDIPHSGIDTIALHITKQKILRIDYIHF